MNKKLIIPFLFILILSVVMNFVLRDAREDSFKETIYEKIVYDDNNYIIDTRDKQDINNLSVYFCPDDNCSQILLDLIENTKESMYCAVYDISSRDVYNKLIDKEIDIKIVTDLERSKSINSLIGLLKANNITVIESPLSSKLMHNKFCVFDEEITLVGSMNFTYNCLYKNNNDILVIEDKDIASFFIEKIDSYFQGYFYNDQERYLSQEFLDIYFCPDNDCEKIVLNTFRNVEYSLDCMYFTFTLDEAIYELEDNINFNNIDKRFMLERRVVSQHSVYEYLKEINIPVILDNNPNTMHNKFCIVDDFVLTGSLNITKRGPTNEETVVFLYDQDIVNKYKAYFNKYWEEWESKLKNNLLK